MLQHVHSNPTLLEDDAEVPWKVEPGLHDSDENTEVRVRKEVETKPTEFHQSEDEEVSC